MSKVVKVLRVGLMDYKISLKLQHHLQALHHQSKDKRNFDTIILTEHNPVYTIGIRTKNYSQNEEDRLRSLGADFYRTNRGGLITFHGPGQLVVYPIINLKNFKTSVRWYVNNVENTVVETCKKLKIEAEPSENHGVWVGDKKICAIGIHASRYITTHGLAINCNTDLKWFEHIVPCGIEGKGVTSFSEQIKRNVTINEIAPLFLESFSKVFECECVDLNDYEQEKFVNSVYF